MNNGGNKTYLFGALLLRGCLLLSLLLAASGAAAEEPEHYWITAESYTWTYQTGENNSSFSAYINGELLPDQSSIFVNHKGVYHAQINLLPLEKNAVEIKQNDTVLFSIVLFQASNFESALVPDEYAPHVFHQEAKESQCIACHRMDIQDRDRQPTSSEESLCYSCHSRNFKILSYQHTDAVTKWLCLKCHQPEFSENDDQPDLTNRFFIQEGEYLAPLCYQCHKNLEKQISSDEYIHGPIGMEGCSMCHNSHGSNIKFLLEKKASTLCVECHEKQDIFDQAVVHAVLLKEECISCHDSHSSNFRYQLLAEGADLCYKCHPQIKKQKDNHPVNGHPVSGPKHPLHPDEPFSCTSCHTPHSSEYDKLLPEPETMMVCISCHPM